MARLPTPSTPLPYAITSLTLRFLQLVFGITVIGLYGVDLHAAHREHRYTDGKWGYAVAVGSMSAVTALVYALPKVKSWWGFGWDTVLFILWAAVFGIFGKMYIHEQTEGDTGVKRMKNSVWIDLINMLLWLVSAVLGALMFFFLGKKRSLHTGRATV